MITRDNSPEGVERAAVRKEFKDAMQRRRNWNMVHAFVNLAIATVMIFVTLPFVPNLIVTALFWGSMGWVWYRIYTLNPKRTGENDV